MMSLIPRSATCPSFNGPGRSSPFSGSLSFLAPRGPSSEVLGSCSSTTSGTSSSSGNGGGRSSVGAWRNLLVAIAILYGLAFITLPIAYVRLSGGAQPSQTMQPGSGLAGSRSLNARRMALQTLEWPDTGLAQRHYGSKNAAQPRVEFRDAGYIVDLAEALDATAWDDLPLYHPSPVTQAMEAATGAVGGSGEPQPNGAQTLRFPAWCPQSDVRLFVAVTSRCCTKESQAKRNAIRSTWMKDLQRLHPNVAVRFVLAQPTTPAEVAAGVELLSDEIHQHADVIVVPGQELYRYLPNKTLQLLKYALSSPCKFTHIVKTDEDVYLRLPGLLNIIATGAHAFSMDIQGDARSGEEFDGVRPASLQAPWMTGMYVGQLDSNKSGVWPGWAPLRDPTNKWYLSAEDLPDALAEPLLGVRWASGWGYVLSRDLAEIVTRTAEMYAAAPHKKPGWWGRMPWEDIMVAAVLRDVGARVSHHEGFKAAWNDCSTDTVFKHLDNDAPLLQEGLHVQDRSGLWDRRSVTCTTGDFEPDNYTQWRVWRNSLPDNQLGGFM